MRKHILTLLLGLVLTATNASAASTMIDFEDGTPGDRVDDFYADLGALFSSDGDTVVANGPSFSDRYGSSHTVADLSLGTAPSFNIRVDFTHLVTDVAVDVSSGVGTTLTMSVFGFGDLLGTETSTNRSLPTFERLSFSAGEITHLLFVTSSPRSGAPIIDNLEFTASPIPLPAGLPLLIAGLGALTAMRYRRKG